MLTITLFEIDLAERRLIFPQAGLLEGYVDSGRAYDHDDWLQRFADELVFSDDRGKVLKTFRIENYFQGKGDLHCEFRLLDQRTDRCEWVYMNALRSSGGARAFGTMENIDTQKKAELEVGQEGWRDILTGLLNREAFERAASTILQEPEAAGMYALLDVDDFKRVNTSMGHGYGDWLLVEIGRALRGCLPENAILGRYGADTFMFCIPGVDGPAQADHYAQLAAGAVAAIQPDRLPLTCSIGVAFYPLSQGARGADDVAARAETAMDQAKARGKNQFCLYEPRMDRRGLGRLGAWRRAVCRQLAVWLRINRAYALVLLAGSAMLVLILALFTGVYTKELQDVVDQESYSYLDEISTQMNTSLVRGMTGNYATLASLAAQVWQVQDWPLDKILSDLSYDAEILDYGQIALIDEQGTWITQNGAYSLPELMPDILLMRDSGRPVTTEILALFGQDCVTFLHPLNNTVIDGQRMIGVAAIADMEKLNNMLYLTLFDGVGYSHVVTSNGSAIIRSNHETNGFHSYNLLKYLERASFSDGVTIDMVRSDFSRGNSRKIHYSIDGSDLLSIYAPVGYSDWYLFTVIPSGILNGRTTSFYQLTVLACVVISILFLLLFSAIFLIQMRSRQQLVRQIYLDPVTGGPSKSKFELDCQTLLQSQDRRYSILYANVSRFKLVNERDGNEAGDRLLFEIYRIIAQELDSDERVSRLMADHFGILTATQNMAFLQRRAEEWNQRIQAHVTQGKITTAVSMNYGVFPIEGAAEHVSLLLDKANLARKSAPAGTTFAIYDAALADRLHLEAELESRQDRALENHEFVVYFQPKYCPKTNKIVGAEALVRWITQDKGMLTPDKYIPLFESNGFILRLDLYVFDQTCRFLAGLIADGLPPIPISVNLSRSNLNNPDFLHAYVAVWEKYGIDAALLEFEITESLVYENMERLGYLTDDIHRHGFQVSMDDFGSGYSSLNMLKSVNIDTIKLDREFFNRSKSTEERALLIVRRLIELVKDLGMTVVAEGVETQDLVDFLRQQECDMIQGYYYSRPIPAGEMRALLEKEGES